MTKINWSRRRTEHFEERDWEALRLWRGRNKEARDMFCPFKYQDIPVRCVNFCQAMFPKGENFRINTCPCEQFESDYCLRVVKKLLKDHEATYGQAA